MPNDDNLDLVSARFADLVAHDHYAKLMDALSHQLFRCQAEKQLAHKLLAALHQRCGVVQALYLVPETGGRYRVLETTGLPPELADTPPLLLQLPAHPHHVLQTSDIPNWSQTLLSHLPLKSALYLSWEGEPLALILLDRQPGHHVLRDFLNRLCERASQALSAVRVRQSLDSLRKDYQDQQKTVIQQTRMLSLMEDWTGVLNMLQDRVSHLEDMLVHAVQALDADKGSLMLFDEPRGELVVRAIHGIDPEVAERIRSGEQPCKKLRLGEGVAGKVAQTLQPMIVNQVEREPLFLEPELSKVSSILCLPLHVDGLVLGVLNLTNRAPGKRFQASHVEDGMKLAAKTAQAINNSRLFHLSVLDPVTEVYTRSHLYHRIQDEINRARRYQRQLSLLSLGIQGLAGVRARLGDDLCNRIEIEVSQVLLEVVRETDVVGRLGDSSLGILLPETDSMQAMFVCERIQQEMRKSKLARAHSITLYAGVCSFPDKADTILKLVARAESAMHSAWRYPNEISVYVQPSPELDQEAATA